MAKVIIYLQVHELAALNDLAQREYRTLKAQATLIIHRELEKLGMIPGEQQVNSNQNEPLSTARDKTVMVEG
ncbi:MAG: hypothetical protein Q7T89_18500 [Anaerolineales bacterium]|nr:hypothetical protein [Anaerolineales bacterium]